MNDLQSSMQITLFLYIIITFMSWMTLKSIKGYIERGEVLPLASMIAWWITPLIRIMIKLEV